MRPLRDRLAQETLTRAGSPACFFRSLSLFLFRITFFSSSPPEHLCAPPSETRRKEWQVSTPKSLTYHGEDMYIYRRVYIWMYVRQRIIQIQQSPLPLSISSSGIRKRTGVSDLGEPITHYPTARITKSPDAEEKEKKKQKKTKNDSPDRLHGVWLCINLRYRRTTS